MEEFDAILARVLSLLQQEGRASYRALKLRFSLNDDYIAALKDEIIEVKRQAVDRDGTVLEAVRKPCSTVVYILSSIRTVMKGRMTTWLKSVQHKMNIANLQHSSTGLYSSFIVFAVSTEPTMPGVRPLNHPAFLQGCEAFRARRTRLDFDAPRCAMLRHPGVKGVIVIFLIGKDRAETRKVTRLDLSQQLRGRNAVIQTGTRNHNGQQKPQGIDQHMPLAPFDFLAAIIATLGPPHLGRLDRLTIDARRTRRGLTPGCYTRLLAQRLDDLGPCAVIAPLGKVVIHSALGQQIMG